MLVMGIAKNVLVQEQRVHLAKEICISTILNVFQYVLNQHYRVDRFVLIVMQHVLNALQLLMYAQFVKLGCISMNKNAKNALTDG